MLEIFEKFVKDPDGWDMYITGRAGTGKTTGLAKLTAYCEANKIDYTVCAFTHKACGVLRSKLPEGSNIKTLHSFLRKRPTINQAATNQKYVTISQKFGDTGEASILFIDEYSMVGEQDLMDIRAEQDETEDGTPTLKVVWLGDPNQLPPVGDMQSVHPNGPYSITLTKVYRQASYNPLLDTLDKIISFIDGETPTALEQHETFQRDKDILKEYLNDPADKVLLAYTNKQVQALNAEAEGKKLPDKGDKVFSPNTKEYYTFLEFVPNYAISSITIPYSGEELLRGTKYKTLERLTQMHEHFALLVNEEGEELLMAVDFGHYDYKIQLEYLKREAAETNKEICGTFGVNNAAQWAKQNHSHSLARERGKAWSRFLTYNQCVICIDFVHAMTIHKSQGSTYENVYLDMQDLGIAAEMHYPTYLKLMYVAMSRASQKVVTN